MPVLRDEYRGAQDFDRLSTVRGKMETGQQHRGSSGLVHLLQISGLVTPCRRRARGWTGRVRGVPLAAAACPVPAEEEVEQADLLDYQKQNPDVDTARGRNYASLDVLSDEVLEFLHDQAERGQVIELTEAGA